MMTEHHFRRTLDALMVRPCPPWNVWDFTPRLHPILFVHRVDGLEAGAYILVRNPEAEPSLRQQLSDQFVWKQVYDDLPFYHLIAADSRAALRKLSCHQAIAADCCLTLGMLAEFDTIVANDPWRYRQLFWEAGMIGQSLYLEAEAGGLRGTGIGCYFDDDFHEIIGLPAGTFKSLYHFTIGDPVVDDRIATHPPYEHLKDRL
jgi:nitroreductase